MEQKICDGTWVTMITPFTKENKIDYPGVAEIIEWYIQKGIDGIFAVCQSSEMLSLIHILSAGKQAYFEDEEESQPADAELYPETAEPFLDAMDRYQISWAGWALCNKAEWHSAIRPDCTKYSGWDEDCLLYTSRCV